MMKIYLFNLSKAARKGSWCEKPCGTRERTTLITFLTFLLSHGIKVREGEKNRANNSGAIHAKRWQRWVRLFIPWSLLDFLKLDLWEFGGKGRIGLGELERNGRGNELKIIKRESRLWSLVVAR